METLFWIILKNGQVGEILYRLTPTDQFFDKTTSEPVVCQPSSSIVRYRNLGIRVRDYFLSTISASDFIVSIFPVDFYKY